MARGWESKSVEEQQSSADARHSPAPAISLDELNRLRQKESLQLDRTRIVHDLEHASNPRYRAMLNRALKHLDGKLAEFDRPTPPPV
jgi:hypothetical protein